MGKREKEKQKNASSFTAAREGLETPAGRRSRDRGKIEATEGRTCHGDVGRSNPLATRGWG